MNRLISVIASIGILFAAVVEARQSPSTVAGKWDVTVTGQPTRTLELITEGEVVTGTLTKHGSQLATVRGEFKHGNLILETQARDEFLTVVVRGDGLMGTYVHEPYIKDLCYKTGVTLKRPPTTN